MEITFLIIAILLVLGVAYVAQSIGRIKRQRALGNKLSKRNLYYALLTKIFVRDLPD